MSDFLKDFFIDACVCLISFFIGIYLAVSSEQYKIKCCEDILNDDSYNIDTLKIIQGNDTTISYKVKSK